MTQEEVEKLALRIVALDRQLASAMKAALRTWSRTKRSTPRTFAALRLAGELERALEGTLVQRRPRRRRPAAG